jgi:hypothetical protein
VRRAQHQIPELEVSDVGTRSAGIGAQAVDHNGRLVDDVVVHRREPVVAVRNAPSPRQRRGLERYTCATCTSMVPHGAGA